MGNSSSCLSPASSPGSPQLASPPTQHLSHCRSQFQAAGGGQSGISRRKFSEIMQQCFPRTHKVSTQS